MCLKPDSEASDAWKHHVDDVIRRTTRQSRFFITDQGRIGLGPAGLVSGDVVFVARGGELPLALRLCPSGTLGFPCSHNRLISFTLLGRLMSLVSWMGKLSQVTLTPQGLFISDNCATCG